MNKTAWLDAAEVFDSWRVFPRVLVAGFAIWVVYLFDILIRWYIAIAHTEVGLLGVQSAFVFGVLSAMSTLSGYIFKVYTDGGRDWQEDRANRAGETAVAVAVAK